MPVYSYIGKGKIYLQKRGVAAGLMPIGNCSKLELGVQEEKKDLPDYQNPGGGKANSISRIVGVTMAITAHDLSPDNLSIALRGGTTAISAGAVANEPHVAYSGALIVFDFLPDPNEPINITNTAGTTTYDEGDDYVVTRAGIIPTSGGAITPGSTVHCDYTKLVSDEIEALTVAAAEYRLVFDGLNEAASGAAVVVTGHRSKFSPAASIGLIGDEFASQELSGELLKDETITGTGISQYAKIKMARAA